MEEGLAQIRGDQLHVLVADVIKSFDIVDRSILDCALGRLGLPAWFRRVYFACRSQVRIGFGLASSLKEPWCRDGGIPQGCPLSMVFIVALYVPWCRRLEATPAVRTQLYADNLKCGAECPNALFGAARFTAQYVRSVGHDVSPGKCVLLSTSKAARRVMKHWDVSGDGKFSWMTEILVVISILPGGLVHFLRGLRKLRLLSLQLVPCFLGFRSSWAWCGRNVCLLVCMLLRRRMWLPLPLALFGLPL